MEIPNFASRWDPKPAPVTTSTELLNACSQIQFRRDALQAPCQLPLARTDWKLLRECPLRHVILYPQSFSCWWPVVPIPLPSRREVHGKPWIAESRPAVSPGTIRSMPQTYQPIILQQAEPFRLFYPSSTINIVKRMSTTHSPSIFLNQK